MTIYLLINILGVLLFMGLAWLFSKDRKTIHWRSIIVLVLLNIFLAWLLTSFSAGRFAIEKVADGFN